MKKILCLFTVFAAFLTTNVQAHIYDFKVPDQKMRLLTGFNGESLYNSTEPDTIFVFCTDDENDNTAYITRDHYVWGQGMVYNDTLWKITLTPEGEVSVNTYNLQNIRIIYYSDVVGAPSYDPATDIWTLKYVRSSSGNPLVDGPEYSIRVKYRQTHYTPITAIITDTPYDGYLWHDSLYKEPGLYTIDSLKPNGCPFSDKLKLEILHVEVSGGDICPGDSTDLLVSVSKLGTPRRIPRPGDVLCTDGTILHPDSFLQSGKTAMGVVVLADPAEGFGRAVSLSNARDHLADDPSMFWATIACSAYVESNTTVYNYLEAFMDMDGEGNTERMLSSARDAGVTNLELNVPAARNSRYYDHRSYTTCSGNNCDSLGWYLPALGEMKLLHAYRVEVNNTLRMLRRLQTHPPYIDSIIESHAYWSSTKSHISGSGHYAHTLTGESSTKYEAEGNIRKHVRPMIKFPLPEGTNSLAAQVGDLMTFPDGSQGIVCYVDPNDNQKGWVVDLYDIEGTHQIWNSSNPIDLDYSKVPIRKPVHPSISTYYPNYYSQQFDLADWIQDGKGDTDSLYNAEEGNLYSPAAKAVHPETGWYIPDAHQLMMLMGMVPVLKPAFERAGVGDIAIVHQDGRNYWSSTRKSQIEFFFYKHEYQSSLTNDYQYTYKHIRRVRDFDNSNNLQAYWAIQPKEDSIRVSPETTTVYDALVIYNTDTFTVQQTVNVYPTKNTTLYDTVNYAGVPFDTTIRNLTFHVAGIGNDTLNVTLQTHLGCDSIVSVVLTAVKTKLTVTVADTSKTYGYPDPDNFGFTVEGLSEGHRFAESVKANRAKVTSGDYATQWLGTEVAGTYVITLKNQDIVVLDASNNNVTDAYDFGTHDFTGTFTINKRPFTIQINDTTVTLMQVDSVVPTYTVTGLFGDFDGGVRKDTVQNNALRFIINNDIAIDTAGVYEINAVLAEGKSEDELVGRNPNVGNSYIPTIIPGELTITPGTFSITATGYEGKYDGYSHAGTVTVPSDITATLSYSTNGGSTWSSTAPTAKDVADSKTVQVRASAEGYLDATASYDLTVTKRTVTLTSANDEKVYDGTPLTNSTVTVTGDGFVNGEGATYSISGTQTDAGSSPNTFTHTLNSGTLADNYEITTTNGTLTVTPKAVTVTANDASKQYGEPDPEFSAVVTGTIGTDVISYTVTRPGAGSFAYERVDTYSNAIVPAGETLQGNYTVTYVSANFTITLSDAMVLTVYDYDGVYDGWAHGEPASVNVTDATITYLRNHSAESEDFAPQIKDVDSITVTATATSLFYTTKTATYTIQVRPRPLTIITGSDSKTYDGTPLKKGGEMSGLVEGELATLKVTGSQTNAGSSDNTYEIDWDGNAKEPNYTVENETIGTLTVTKRNVTLTSASDEKVYDGTPLTNSNVTVGDDGFANGEGATYIVTGSQTDAGSSANAFTYTLNSGTSSGNYDITTTEGTLTVTNNTTAITLTAGSANKTYDGTALTNSDFTSTGLPAGFTAEVTMTTASTITNAGSQANVIDSYVIKNSAGEDKTAYFTNVTTANGTLTVNPATVTITTGSASKGYDGSPLTKDGEMSGLVNGETATFTVTGSQTNAGTSPNTYSLTWNGTANSNNYTVNETIGTLTVSKRNVTLTSASDEKVYDGTPLTNSTVTVGDDGFANGEGATYNVTGSQTDAGNSQNTFTYTLNSGTSAGNYEITTTEGTLTVNRRPVHVTANNSNKQFGAADPTFTAQVTGTIGTDVITYTVTRPGAGTDEAVGTYPDAIVPAGAAQQGNYQVNYFNGDFTIAASNEMLLTVTDYLDEYDGHSHSEPATASVTDATITYSTDDGATWSTTVPQIKDVGTITVNAKATHPGYTDKTATYTLKVTPAPLTITTGSDSKTYDGTPLTKDGVMTGLVNGETATFSVTGSQTNAGTSPNTYSLTWNGTANSNNYTVNETIGTLTVAKRNVTLTSASDEKVYDGTPLTNSTVTVGGDGFANGEGATYNVTGSQTDAGSSANAFTYTLNSGTLAGNYEITTTEGTLTVTNNTTAITLTAGSANKTYDGTALTNSDFTSTGLPAGFTAEVTMTTASTITNAGSQANVIDSYVIKNSAGEDKTAYFTNVTTANGTLTVAKRNVTLTSASDEKVYDGTPLTNNTVTVSGDGFVTGEGTTYNVTGSQTDAGNSQNTFTYTLNSGTLAGNYEITTTEGILTVNPKTIHVRADNNKKKCGGDDPVFTFSIENLSRSYHLVDDPQGILESEGITPYIFSYTIDREETEYIGAYDIIPSVKYDGIYDPGNYVFTYDTGKLIVEAKDSTITRTVCESELPYLWEGVLFDSASTDTVQVTAADGCVTLLEMVLSTSQPEYIGDTTVVIVNTDGTTPNGYTWHGTTYTEPGTYAYNLSEGTGCVIDILHLVVLDVDTTIGNICQGGSTEISIDVTKRPATATSNLIPRVPQLGDVLCTDGYTMSIYDFIGSGKTAKGVVVQVDAEDGYGRAISLYDTPDLSWVGASAYYNYVNPNGAGVWHQAITDMGGDTNTRNMLGVIWDVIILGEAHYYWSFPTLQQMSNRSPAAYACAYYNGTSPSLSSNNRDARWLGWYLPAAGEMMLAFANRTEINKTLSELHNLNSDYQPLSNCDYWTSTKGGIAQQPAWYITSDGNLRHAKFDEQKAVRPFIKFQIK